MAGVYEPETRTQFVWVKDRGGNEYVCPRETLRDPGRASDDELARCIDEATSPQPYAGG